MSCDLFHHIDPVSGCCLRCGLQVQETDSPCKIGHVIDDRNGRCGRCGEYLRTFDAMEAAYLIKQGKSVRQPDWEPGVYLKLDNDWVKRYNRDGTSTTAASLLVTLQDLLGPWELVKG